MISYIVCKWREQLFKNRALPALEVQCKRFDAELIIVQHPTSIFAAYEEGRRKACHEITVYLHDDVELLDPETSPKLAKIFKDNIDLGLLGVLGSEDQNVVPWWNNLQMLGHIICPDRSSSTRPLSVLNKIIASRFGRYPTFNYIYASKYGSFRYKRVRVPKGGFANWHTLSTKSKWYGLHPAGFIDGLFMAERCNDIPWDTETFSGWHGYDLDRSLQMRSAGWQVAVSELLVLHDGQSHTRDWHRNHDENLQKISTKWGIGRAGLGWRLYTMWTQELSRIKTILRNSPYTTIKKQAEVGSKFWHLAGQAIRRGALHKRYELARMYAIVAQLKPKTVLEIGLSSGANLSIWSQLAADDALIVGLDLKKPTGLKQQELSIKPKQSIDIVLGDSHNPVIFNDIRKKFPQGIDFLFIDGDHSYAGVKQDFDEYSRLVNQGGIIMMHDINPDWRELYGRECDEDSGKVYQVWQELKGTRKTDEIIDQIGQSGYGIGVIWL